MPAFARLTGIPHPLWTDGNGKPCAGWLLRWRDAEATDLAQVWADAYGMIPQQNPMRLNADGSLPNGGDVFGDVEKWYDLDVMNPDGAVMWTARDIKPGCTQVTVVINVNEVEGKCKFFPYNAKTACLHVLPGSLDTFNVFVKSKDFYHNFFISFDVIKNSSGCYVSSFRLTGSNQNDFLNGRNVYFAQYGNDVYLVISGASNCELFWFNPGLEPATLPAGEPSKKWELMYVDNDFCTHGVGSFEVTSDKAYIAPGAKLKMLGSGEARFKNGYSLDMFDNVSLHMRHGATIAMERWVEMRFDNGASFIMRNQAGMNIERGANVNVKDYASLSICDYANIEVSNQASIGVHNRANINVTNMAGVNVSDEANVNINGKAGLNVWSRSHIQVTNDSGLDVGNNSDVCIDSSNWFVFNASARKLWVIDESCLLMCDSYHFGLLQDYGQQARRLLAVLDQAKAVLRDGAKLEMNGNAEVSVKNGAKLEMNGGGTLKVGDAASVIAGWDVRVFFVGDSCHTGYGFRRTSFNFACTKIKITESQRIDWQEPWQTVGGSEIGTENFLGNEYKFWNGRKDGEEVNLEYYVFEASELVQKTVAIPDNKYIKIMLVEIEEKEEDGRKLYKPIFAEEA